MGAKALYSLLLCIALAFFICTAPSGLAVIYVITSPDGVANVVSSDFLLDK
jgi:hypothetical protein